MIDFLGCFVCVLCLVTSQQGTHVGMCQQQEDSRIDGHVKDDYTSERTRPHEDRMRTKKNYYWKNKVTTYVKIHRDAKLNGLQQPRRSVLPKNIQLEIQDLLSMKH